MLNGLLNNKFCSFKLDTGSDVLLVSSGVVGRSQCRLLRMPELRYPTGKKVSIKFRCEARIAVGRISLSMSLYIADMHENCILETDFFRKVKPNKAWKIL